MEQITEREEQPAQQPLQQWEVVQVNPGFVRQETFVPGRRHQVAPFAGYLTLRREHLRIR